MAVLRAFIAIDLSPEIRKKLDGVTQDLHNRLPGMNIRWVPGKNIHLTLKFLGDVSIENLEILKNMVRAEAAAHPTFELSIGEIGAFPSIHRPRVVWIGVAAPPVLSKLQYRIETEAAQLGYPIEDRPFSAHLTIGRVSRNAGSRDIQAIGQVVADSEVGTLGKEPVISVCLFRSDLKPDGAVYSLLYSAPLTVVK